MLEEPYARYYTLFAVSSLGVLLALLAALVGMRRERSIPTIALCVGAVALLFAHLLYYWWNVPGTGTFVDGRSYELAQKVFYTHFVATVLGQVTFFGGLFAFFLRQPAKGAA